MTYEEAVALRQHQLQGHQVDQTALAEAIAIIRTNLGSVAKVPRRREKRKPKPAAAAPAPVVQAESAAAPAAADPWPLLTPETEARVLDASRNAWAVLGRDE